MRCKRKPGLQAPARFVRGPKFLRGAGDQLEQRVGSAAAIAVPMAQYVKFAGGKTKRHLA
jgi:hypothetical protein